MRPIPVRTLQIDNLSGEIFNSNADLGLAAALDARNQINQAISKKGNANILLATGNSQLSFLHALRDLDGIDWDKVSIFHMDDYINLDPTHRSSFPQFLRVHILDAVKPGKFYPIRTQMADLDQICMAYETLLHENPADLVVLGFGENGHLAFNDPPDARFFDYSWVKVVKLAEKSRWQQYKEGHFDTLEEVPTHAITLTIPALMQARHILCIVPESRKADSVFNCLCGPITEDYPGSILRVVKNAFIYLDVESAVKIPLEKNYAV
jgi:glucosamine-6-phosphate deaminase